MWLATSKELDATKILILDALFELQGAQTTTLAELQQFLESEYPKLSEAGLGAEKRLRIVTNQLSISQLRCEGELKSGCLRLDPGVKRPPESVLKYVKGCLEQFMSGVSQQGTDRPDIDTTLKALVLCTVDALQHFPGYNHILDSRLEEQLAQALSVTPTELNEVLKAAYTSLIVDKQVDVHILSQSVQRISCSQRPEQQLVKNAQATLQEAVKARNTFAKDTREEAKGSAAKRGPQRQLSPPQMAKRSRTEAVEHAPLPESHAGHPASIHSGPLHMEIVQFERRVSQTDQERAAIQECFQIIQNVVTAAKPDARVELFGSQAAGLALPGSDIDVVILDVISPAKPSKGYVGIERSQCMQWLRWLQRILMEGMGHLVDHTKPLTRISARVPILKFSMKVRASGGQHSIPVDVSFGQEGGVVGIQAMRSHIACLPPLKPLVLLLKAFLKDHDLLEVHTGGLSSYSLLNMVIAHLQAERYPTGGRAPPNNVVQDLGVLLWGFFVRFGDLFGYSNQAVSVRQGGVVEKGRVTPNGKPDRLAVEDLVQPGKNISDGSTKIKEVERVFSKAAQDIAAAVSQALANDEQPPSEFCVLEKLLPVRELLAHR